MPGQEKCCQCMNIFSMLRLPRKLPCCQHNICEPCIRQIIDNKQEIIFCAFCNNTVTKQDIRIFPLNTPLLLTLSEQPQKQPILPKEDENQLLGDLILTPQVNPDSEQICPTHKVTMDIICISDKQRICPHCALFGAHRDHRFKRLDDFDRQLTQKKKVFVEIQTDKDKALHNELGHLNTQLHKRIHKHTLSLRTKIEEQFRRFELELRKKKEESLREVDGLMAVVEKELKEHGPIEKFNKVREKLQTWQKSCLSSLYKLEATKRIEDKLLYYYQGPLEIVTQGYIFIQQLNKCRQEALDRIDSALSQIELQLDSGKSWFEKCVKLHRKTQKQEHKEEDLDANPFLDCTSSEIILGTNSFLHNNTSLEVDIASIPSSSKVEEVPTHTPKRRDTDIKHLRSVEKQRPRIQTQVNFNTPCLKKTPQNSFYSPRASKRPISQISSFKSPGKVMKNTSGKDHSMLGKQMTEVCEQQETKEPQKIYLQFSKNTLSDFFDISDCGLSSDKVVDYVHRARRTHKIRGLKICNNGLTNSGFDRMTQFIQGVSNINAANNQLTEGIFQVILRNRERLVSLKILNLTHNPVNLQKNKGSAKMQEVKKMGIIITL